MRQESARKIARLEVFTPGQVAQLCSCAPRTVHDWVDSGRLEGYRLPLSRDRRIQRKDLLRFLYRHRLVHALEQLLGAEDYARAIAALEAAAPPLAPEGRQQPMPRQGLPVAPGTHASCQGETGVK